MPEDRRKFERVECYMIVRKNRADEEEEDFFGVARNVSTGGAMIETDASVEVGHVLELSFLLESEKQVWETQARVVWTRPLGEKNILGLEFMYPLEPDWHLLLD
jgi:hypothetical protein